VPEYPYENEDDRDDLFAAMDFSAAQEDAAKRDTSTALDFSATGDGQAQTSAIDLAPVHATAEPEDTATVLEAIDSVTHAPEDEETNDVAPLYTVTNPPGTVSVSALGDGAIDRVELSAEVTRLTEAQLAEEILVVAHLATQQGQAAQHEFLLTTMRELGADDPDALRDMLEKGMELASPERAAETQAHVFGTRYHSD
ncbi:ESX-1 secretion-associated protein EspH, partial [Mycobacterium numidiamassiliense]